jgi:2-phospho-L-lactate/phosphoenolpyruvate guanylyltransferase
MRLDPATLWTIVPVRGLAAGKSRLAPVLNQAERATLNRELLERTLAVVNEWSGAPQRTIVVSSCPHALALARKTGAMAVREGTRAVGQNRAASLGVTRAAAQGALHFLVVSCDLPYLGTGALRALVSASGGGKQVVLAPDKAGTGTNAVLVGAGADFQFAFGPASLMAHQGIARRVGLAVSLVQREDLQFDLDTPVDLARWRTKARGAGPASREAV